VAGIRPVARTDSLLIVTEEADGELLLYDEEQAVSCRLNATAALVWQNCDGNRTVQDLVEVLAGQVGEVASEDMVMMALDNLVSHGLLLSGYEKREGSAERLSRRRFFGRAGIVGAAAVAAPVVYTLAVPEAAAAHPSYGTDYTIYT
jgi:hypothetical protein